VALTGEQLIRLATRATAGQAILVIGALGSVGRAAVHSAKKLGAKVIAGVRARQVAEAETLDVAGVIALDDDAAIERLDAVDGIADTVGGDTAAKLIRNVKAGGRFGYVAMLPPDVVANNPAIEFSRIFARPDAAKLREFADDIRDGTFVLPISQRLPLSETAAAHAQLEKGGGGKVVLTI
jgi:NADPH:quinone reductase-like Zn-dependent oxidoreductase